MKFAIRDLRRTSSTPIAAGPFVLAVFSVWACEHAATPVSPSEAAVVEAQPPRDLPLALDQPWDALDGDNWSYLRRSSSKDDQIVTDAQAPCSPPNVLQITFTPDMLRDHEPSVHWMALPHTREVYALLCVKLSSNWSASPAGGGKINFLHTWPDGQGQIYSNIGGSSAPHRIDVNTEWAPYGQQFWEPNKTSTPITYNRWYRIGWYVKWSSSRSVSDGIIRWWVDGRLNGDYTSVTFPADGDGFQQFEFAPTLQNPPPSEQYMYVDHTSVSYR